MRKIIGSLFQSLDGVIQAPGGPEEDQTGFAPGGWVSPYFDDALDEPMGRLLGGSYELLLGRRTYEIFAAYWPHNGDQPIGETFNAVRQRVSTSHRLRVMERFVPAALPQNPRAKTNLRSVSVKRRVVGEPPALRPPIQQLHVEGADRAIGGRGGRDPVQNFVCLAPTPFGQSPLLVDGDRSVVEATDIA